MKRILLISGIAISGLLFISIIGLHTWIGSDVKENIRIAKSMYPGNAEDALIAYLQDGSNDPEKRTHLAVWTLGQIRSEKALPILKELYINDPEGATCYGKHHQMICQYELHKAIKSIEHRRRVSHASQNESANAD